MLKGIEKPIAMADKALDASCVIEWKGCRELRNISTFE